MADQYQADDPDRRRAVDSEVVLEGQGRGLTVPWAPGLARSLTAEFGGPPSRQCLDRCKRGGLWAHL